MPIKTHYPVTEIWSTKEMEQFRNKIHQKLFEGVITVVFTKRDGTERTMRCTLSPEIVPQKTDSESTKSPAVTPSKDKPIDPFDFDNLDTPVSSKRQKVYNPDVRSVYDVDANAWRSFLWNSVKSISYFETEA